jgi:D-beta-D-heptose 7-phosphate kinase/D-beta-D-heptose 1-phosphate adenosyltransferase
MHIPQFSKAKILIIGDVMLDRYWTGTTQRISPEAPVPVVKVNTSEDRLGGAGNVAANIARLGAQAELIGAIGDDDAGTTLEQLADEQKIIHKLIRITGRPTVTKLRVISRHQQLLRMDFEQPNHLDDPLLITREAENHLADVQALVISDYAKGALSDCSAIIQQATQREIASIVDPKGVSWDRYRGATLITPNLSEFQLVVGTCSTDAEILEKARALCAELELGGILITLSDRGMMLVPAVGDFLQIATQAREVFDVTGAGDTVIGVLAASLAAGSSLTEATRLANAAAGLVVGRLGAASVTAEELSHALLYSGVGLNQGALDQKELANQLGAARQRGERIVFTNGCFDILHPGHIKYLEAAAKLGDRLIVAVNSDDSVSRLKGPERPINNLADRMAMLAALSSVDWVTSFDEDTPAMLIKQLQPHILVKGGDYRVEDIAGSEAVIASGGEVKILPFEEGYSTTSLLDRVRNSP